MHTWRIACSAALVAVGLSATPAHADEWNKLTLLTFSGPVAMPGITLPPGTYRFELMDPDTGRRVVRVSDKDGSKNYGIFLSISDQRLEPSNNPVVLFREMPAGLPQAIRAWFYPGESTGYEFVYPHDQAQKIAKATHQSVLAMKEPASSTTESDRVASMRGAQVGRIDENGNPVSSDERLKDSSGQHPAATTTAAAQTAPRTATAPSTAASTTTAPASNTARNNASNTARSTTTAKAQSSQPATASTATASVGTSGRATSRSLPRTASSEPLAALLSLVMLGAAAGVHAARKAIA